MNLYRLTIIILIALVLAINIKSIKTIKVIYLKSLVLPLVCITFILMLIIFSDTAVKSAGSGLTCGLMLYFLPSSLFCCIRNPLQDRVY